MANITVVGGGAMGLLLCAKLALSGQPAELIVRTDRQRDELRQSGLFLVVNGIRRRIETAGEDAPLVVNALSDMASSTRQIREMMREEPHYIILAVKQTAVTRELAELTAALAKGKAQIVCIQNGIGHVDKLSAVIPLSDIWLSVTTEGALKRSFTEVEHTGTGTTWIGPAEACISEAPDGAGMQKSWLDCLLQAGFHALMSNNITSRVWHKLLINAVINPLTAILRIRNGELPERPEACRLMRELFEEGAGLADKLGIELAPRLWDEVLEVCRLTAANRSSMLQDVLAGRRTEIDSISGGLLDRARVTEHPMPVTQTAYRLVKALEENNQTQAE
ncbi:2-dehydropantoate 2-reductase [Paenibacillus filicis]|uniref:2-dehydropantoate 2-reductase n=1 Tax=Paenibacillus gyeongsangnamensis TaxID=3388067 RepID=A0ABT4Q2V9_9BACL|nr:2-dehydropantoate 2-reductase [Paenibacillus filicis]MCZ8511212.1 2-dehydropantoate 2-reductase [Paenibacillus filicis]